MRKRSFRSDESWVAVATATDHNLDVFSELQFGLQEAEKTDIKEFLVEMSSALQEANKKIECRIESMGKTMDAMDKRLERIEVAMGVKGDADAENDAEDRKRMKERLKEALNSHKKNFKSEVEQPGLLEYAFGICKPDGRIGKHGSRFSRSDNSRDCFSRLWGAANLIAGSFIHNRDSCKVCK